MIGSFVTGILALVLGYAYPAYECFKTVELKKPDIDQLLFWCQYWILVTALTVFERVGDNFVSWLPMYSEVKLVFFVYLWCPKTKGTSYIYETFFRPYVAKHENEIDRHLLELKTRAGDFLILHFQKVANFGQTRLFEILQYVASQSPSQASRAHPVQRPPLQQQKMPQKTRRTLTADEQNKQPKSVPSSPHSQQPEKGVAVNVPETSSCQPNPVDSTGQKETSQVAVTNSTDKGKAKEPLQVVPKTTDSEKVMDPNPLVTEPPIDEAIRVTRARLRKRTAPASPAR